MMAHTQQVTQVPKFPISRVEVGKHAGKKNDKNFFRQSTQKVDVYAGRQSCTATGPVVSRIRSLLLIAMTILIPEAMAAIDFDLASATGTKGFTMTSIGPGSIVSSAGDINGDGVDDIITSHLETNVGKTYVLFGKRNTIIGNIDLSNFVTGQTTGFQIVSTAPGDQSGWAVSKAGDVNGDGIDDLIMGVWMASLTGRSYAGIAYVIFGRRVTSGANAFTDITLSNAPLAAGVGFRILGAAAGDYGCGAVSGGCDVNGDGIGDVIVGSRYADRIGLGLDNNAGIAYVVFGKNMTGNAAAFGDVDLATIFTGSTLGFRILGTNVEDQLGVSVSCVGDVNGDKISDLILGAYGGNTEAGLSYLIFGRKVTSPANAFGDIYTNNTIPGYLGLRILGPAPYVQSGIAVSGIGDFNNDGVNDFIIGAPYADPPGLAGNSNGGISYVIFGSKVAGGAFPFADMNLADIVSGSTIGFRILGAAAGDFSGSAVAAAGDINGDGIDDIIVGAWLANRSSFTNAGIAYVIFGWASIVYNDVYLAFITTGSQVGFRILGAGVNHKSGYTVNAAGDVNGDSIDDVMVGSFLGNSYVIYGTPPSPTSQPSRQPSGQPSRQPSAQPSRQPTRQPSTQPSRQPSTQPTMQPSAQPTGQPSTKPSNQPSSRPSTQPTEQPTQQPMGIPSCKPSAQPTSQPSRQPTSQPSVQPSQQPSSQPSTQPSVQPSMQPTIQPSMQPSRKPTGEPTRQPSTQPSVLPSGQPSIQPSGQPTAQPSAQPASSPSAQPTMQPSRQPSTQPSSGPSKVPTMQPSTQPSARPTNQPTMQPSCQPSVQPSAIPSTQPVSLPSVVPSTQPSGQPTSRPSVQPTSLPSGQPSGQPSRQPSRQPRSLPSAQPTCSPSITPSSQPTTVPSAQPSGQPSKQPNAQPSSQPSLSPSGQPSAKPTAKPSSQPSYVPSSQPTTVPSAQTTCTPSMQPSVQPSTVPSMQPASQPSAQPSTQPSAQPSTQPSTQPSIQPSTEPSSQPSAQTSALPSLQPTSLPTISPTIDPYAGTWFTVVNDLHDAHRVASINEDIWACGKSNGTATCTVLEMRKGLVINNYNFVWNEMISILQVEEISRVILSGQSNTATGTVTSDLAKCMIDETILTCAVKSYYDTTVAAVTFVSFTNKLLTCGAYNVMPLISTVDATSSVTKNYIYTSKLLKSFQLLRVESVPNFVGGFVAGTGVSTNGAITSIIVGMVRTDLGTMTATSITPLSGTILNSAELVNAMVLEHVHPDSFITGGLELSDGAGMHAYLVRANALFGAVKYGMRYIAISDSDSARRVLDENSLTVRSVSRGLVRIDTMLYMIVDLTHTNSTTSLTVLKVDTETGLILQQVHVSSLNTSLSCTDITTSKDGLFLYISCQIERSHSMIESIIISVDKSLSFAKLPRGFSRSEESVFSAENVPFKKTQLSVSVQSANILVTDSEFSTYDAVPSLLPTTRPSGQPSSSPTAAPSISPQPTSQPSSSGPTNTYKPTVKPTQRQSIAPSRGPTRSPSKNPTFRPTVRPSLASSVAPTIISTRTVSSNKPSARPTQFQSAAPTSSLSGAASLINTNVEKGKKKNSDIALVIGGSIIGGLLGLWFAWWSLKTIVYTLERREKIKAMREMLTAPVPVIPSRKQRIIQEAAHERVTSSAAPLTKRIKDKTTSSADRVNIEDDLENNSMGAETSAFYPLRGANANSRLNTTEVNEVNNNAIPTALVGTKREKSDHSVGSSASSGSSVNMSSLHSSEKSVYNIQAVGRVDTSRGGNLHPQLELPHISKSTRNVETSSIACSGESSEVDDWGISSEEESGESEDSAMYSLPSTGTATDGADMC